MNDSRGVHELCSGRTVILLYTDLVAISVFSAYLPVLHVEGTHGSCREIPGYYGW